MRAAAGARRAGGGGRASAFSAASANQSPRRIPLWVSACGRMWAGDEGGGRRTHERECMTQPQLQDLLEAGVDFGHQTRRWNPKRRRFIFAERSGIYIIDLQKTLRQIEVAQELLRGGVVKGEGVVLS